MSWLELICSLDTRWHFLAHGNTYDHKEGQDSHHGHIDVEHGLLEPTTLKQKTIIMHLQYFYWYFYRHLIFATFSHSP